MARPLCTTVIVDTRHTIRKKGRLILTGVHREKMDSFIGDVSLNTNWDRTRMSAHTSDFSKLLVTPGDQRRQEMRAPDTETLPWQ